MNRFIIRLFPQREGYLEVIGEDNQVSANIAPCEDLENLDQLNEAYAKLRRAGTKEDTFVLLDGTEVPGLFVPEATEE